MITPPPLLLTELELLVLCPGVHQPAARVRHLRAQGFTRARAVEGQVILERAHYEAVCRGEFAAGGPRAHNAPELDLTALHP